MPEIGAHVFYFRGQHVPVTPTSQPVGIEGRSDDGRVRFVQAFAGDWVQAVITKVNADGSINLRYPHHLDGEYAANRVITDSTIMATADLVQEGNGAFMWRAMTEDEIADAGTE